MLHAEAAGKQDNTSSEAIQFREDPCGVELPAVENEDATPRQDIRLPVEDGPVGQIRHGNIGRRTTKHGARGLQAPKQRIAQRVNFTGGHVRKTAQTRQT